LFVRHLFKAETAAVAAFRCNDPVNFRLPGAGVYSFCMKKSPVKEDAEDEFFPVA
jgi:hypothetical protein